MKRFFTLVAMIAVMIMATTATSFGGVAEDVVTEQTLFEGKVISSGYYDSFNTSEAAAMLCRSFDIQVEEGEPESWDLPYLNAVNDMGLPVVEAETGEQALCRWLDILHPEKATALAEAGKTLFSDGVFSKGDAVKILWLVKN